MPTLVIGVGRGPKGGPSMPPPEGGAPKSRKPSTAANDDDSKQGTGSKMSTDEALVVRADHHCKDCKQYQANSGECLKVDGVFDPEDGCMRWFTPMSGGDQYNDYEEQGENGPESPAEEAAEGEQ